jgi:tape measure domain-containing protein
MIVGDMEIRLSAGIARLQADMDRARAVVGDATAGIARAADAAKAALSAIGIGAGLSQIIAMSDQYAKFTAQLRLATQSTREYGIAYADVKRIATTAQADLGATGVLYARIANGTRELGIGQQQVAKITETVNLALKVSGATAEESSSAMLQLSQSFASGTLRGEEFNAVNEAAPRLMLALADGIGVPVGALKQMASNGLITSQIMADVLPKALEKLRDEATQVQTISGAFQVLKNNMMEFTGIQSNANGTVALLTGGIGLLANNLGLLMGVISALTAAKLGIWAEAWVLKTYEQIAASVALRSATLANLEAESAAAAGKLAQLSATSAMIGVARAEAIALLSSANVNIAAAESAIAAATAAGAQSFALRTLRLATVELTVAEAARAAMIAELAILGRQQASVAAQVAVATAAQASATAGLAAASGAGAVATGLASRAIGFLGGPIGIIITLLGLAATAWSVWGNKSKAGNEAAAESFDEAQKRIIKGLDEQIAKNEKLIAMQNGGMTKQQADRDLPVINQLADASKRLNDINSKSGEFAPGGGKSNDDVLFARIKVMKDIVDLTEKMKKNDSTGDAAAAVGPAAQALVAVRERLTGVNKQYIEDLALLQTARQKNAISEKEYIALVSQLATEEYKKSVAGQAAEKAKTAADAANKAGLAASLESIKYGIEVEKAIRADGMAKIEELNRQGLASDAALYVAKREAAVAAGIDSGKIKDAEIAEIQKYHAKDAAERRTNAGKIEKLDLEKNEAMRASLEAADLIRSKYIFDSDAPARAAKAASDAEIDAANKDVVALQAQFVAYNKLPSAITAITVAKLEARAVTLGGVEGDNEAEINGINRLVVALKEKAKWEAKVTAQDTGSDVTKAKELLDILTAVDAAAKSAASGMTESFGRVGTAIGGLTTALTGYAVQQQAITAQLAAQKADPKNTPDKIAKLEIAAANASAQAKVKSYGDMASAAKGFFTENSRGYKVIEATEKAFRATEMVLSIQAMAAKLFETTTVTGAKLAANVAEGAGAVATVPIVVGAEAIKSSAYGVTALAAALAAPFPANIPAFTMVAAMLAAIGVAVFGGGGGSAPSASEERQKANGTGSVLGDSNAKSASIQNALDVLDKNSGLGLVHSASMMQSLKELVSGIGGLTTMLVSGTNLTVPAVEANSSSFFSKLGNSIFGGNTSVTDSGISIGKTTLGGVDSGGVTSGQYTDTKTDGGWFSSDKTATQFAGFSSEINTQFAKIFTSMGAAVTAGANVLGLGGSEFTKQLNAFVIDFQNFSTKGMTGDEIQKALEAQLSKIGDDMAKSAIAGLGAYQKVGEGYLETLARVANDYTQFGDVLAVLGKGMTATGIEAVKLSEAAITAAGGLETLTTNTGYFVDNFLTEAEKMAPIAKSVQTALDALGEGSVATMADFKAEVLKAADGMAAGTDGAAGLYAGLIAIAPKFKELQDYAAEISGIKIKSASEIRSEHDDLQKKFNDLTLTSAQLLDQQRAALDSSNQALFDQVQAITAANQATADAKTAADAAAADAKTKAAAQRALDIQLMTAMGDAEGALAATRSDALAALLTDQARATQAQIWAATAASDAIATIKTNASNLLGGVDSAFGVLQKVVSAQKDAATKAHDAEVKAIQLRIDGQTKLVESLKPLSDSLRSTLDSMKLIGSDTQDRAEAQAQIKAALAIAKAGGPLPDADTLKKSLGIVATDASAQFATFADYQRDFYSTQNDIASLGDLSDDAVSLAQKSLDTLNAQKDALDAAYSAEIARLDGVLSAAQTQIDVLKGIDTTALSIAQALQGLASAMAAAQANPVVSSTAAINSAYQTSLGRAPDAAGLQWWQNAAANGASNSSITDGIAGSTEASLGKLYQSVLGRAPDAAGLAFWMNAYGPAMDAAEQADFIKNSAPELQAKSSGSLADFMKANNVLGYDNGGDFPGGLRIVGETQPELEATGPSRIHTAKSLIDSLRSPSGNNDVLVAAVDRLTKTVADQQAALDKMGRDTKRLADGMEVVTDGYNEMRTKEQPV